ncbi:hypothetical protein [Actinotalea sp. K2]|uniref:hypothetical protein n=1 Tax=Actinotalea sp. K2 TaxID=2939438 RepID=UPI00201704D0|nr:hypothetical protein [Actinotalea sp. K2]MCL3861773.1 hypothetical protein [Actinotalea sp. K2]
MPAQDRVLIDLEIAARADVVWAALREPHLVRRWFGWDYDGLEDEIRLIFAEQAVVDERAATLTWPDGDRIVLDPRGEDVTALRVVRSDHAGTEGFDGAYDAVDEGWITFVQQLRFALERHPDQERRTVSALGVGLGPEGDPLLARLGIRPMGGEPVGSAYEVERPDGSRFSGEIFFQTDLQVGLTVAEEGDALLVVARTPPSSAPPEGTAIFVLSTYGVDEGTFPAVERRWADWWTGQGGTAGFPSGPS